MPVERVFLGWDGPCLPRAVAWLSKRYASDQLWDLSQVIIATPGGRAGRRFLELIVEHAQASDRRTLIPPRLVTAGELVDHLFDTKVPPADDLQRLLAQVACIGEASPPVLRLVTAEVPSADDLPGCLALANELTALYETLGADAVRVGAVAEAGRSLADFSEDQRWSALTRLHEEYERILSQQGLQDLHAARFAAIDGPRWRCGHDVVLLGTADLNRMTRLMLDKLDGPITALVAAPESEADHFDQFGAVIVDHWAQRGLDLDPSRLQFVDRSADQIGPAIEAIRQAKDAIDPTADQITIGLGNESDAAMFERALDLAGVLGRAPVATTVAQSRPATLLSAFAAFIGSRRFNDFAVLLRHPDLEAYLGHGIESQDDQNIDVAIGDWLTLLDKYAADHLPGQLTGNWLGDPAGTKRLQAVHDAVLALAPPHVVLPLPEWSVPIATLLERVYGRLELSRGVEADSQLVRALDQLAVALRQQAKLDPQGRLAPAVDMSNAIFLTLSRVGDKPIAPAGGSPAIEMLGWLELALDDAPLLIVTGCNEGQIPRSSGVDTFLPDQVRRVLGISDNHSRYARDMMMLTSIVHSHKHVTLLASRYDQDGEPMVPSRLLLACQGVQLTDRLNQFYRTDSQPSVKPAVLPEPGHNQFIIPLPQPLDKPLERLRVTAFRDYLACPYRFYLAHIRRLKMVDDCDVEMDAGQFGSMAHHVLSMFAQSDLAGSGDAQAIKTYLGDRLEALLRSHFGTERSTSILVQGEYLRQCLIVFADWQVEQVGEGWRIMPQWVEADLEAQLETDAGLKTITGRIDRIDEHPQRGYRVIDYKTAVSGKDPEEAHRRGVRGAKQWIDLQLPLYQTLAEAAGISGRIELGYFRMPRDKAKSGFAPAPWQSDELHSAVAEAQRIFNAIDNGIFWPPSDPPAYDDGFGPICMDPCLERAEAVLETKRHLDQFGQE